jgi:soluble P-type ATPase
VTRTTEIPGRRPLELVHLVLDVNGTLTDRGELIDDVEAQLQKLQETIEVHLVSADTFGSLGRVAALLGVDSRVVADGIQKASLVWQLGARHCAAIGNGANDEAMLREAALGIAVIGPEGAAASTVAAADVVCRSIGDALRLLLDEQALAATLRP